MRLVGPASRRDAHCALKSNVTITTPFRAARPVRTIIGRSVHSGGSETQRAHGLPAEPSGLPFAPGDAGIGRGSVGSGQERQASRHCSERLVDLDERELRWSFGCYIPLGVSLSLRLLVSGRTVQNELQRNEFHVSENQGAQSQQHSHSQPKNCRPDRTDASW